MKTAQDVLALVDVGLAVPLVLLVNFSLFQYLVTTFWRRRCERRVKLLLFIAFLSCAVLVPFAFPDRKLMRNMNDVSEVCSVLTFLMQITILTRDVSKRIKIRSIYILMWCGELLVLAGLAMLLANVVEIVAPDLDMDIVELLDSAVKHVSLVFIVGFRFHFLIIAKGYHKVLETQKREILFYLLFATHEAPFQLLEHATGLDWEHIQALWMRTTIAMCLSMTIKARLSSMGSKKGLTTTKNGPVISNVNGSSHTKSVEEPATAVVPWKKASIVRSAVMIAPQPRKR